MDNKLVVNIMFGPMVVRYNRLPIELL